MKKSLFLTVFSLLAIIPRWLDAEEDVVFEGQARAILKAHCWHCHGEDGKREGGLDLRLRRFIVKGGESGPAVVASEPAKSLLLDRVTTGEMPPGDKRLSAKDINSLRRWVAAGARTARPEPRKFDEASLLSEEELRFWSFQPVRRPPLPAVKAAGRARTAVDRFVLARLEPKGLTFSMAADRRTLARRAYFDLLGLPPTPVQLEAFLADSSPGSYRRLIDQLLASPHYGERWGRHWLDVAGYADSEGYTESDVVRSFAYRYRDYVVSAFNRDKPFDQFVREQLAGDEMVKPPHTNLSAQQIEKLTATGFLRMAPDGTGVSGVDQGVARNEVVAGTLEIVSSSLLGLTVGCARCHNHRYDPISQLDYYRFRAIFDPALDWKKWKPPGARRISLYTQADRAVAAKIESQAAQVDEERKKKTQHYIDRTLEEELETLAEGLRAPLRSAYRAAAAKRTAEQKKLLKEHPSVANISAGSLYLYDRRREERARKIEREFAGKEKRLVEQTRQQALAKIAADTRQEVLQALQAGSKRNAVQRRLLEKYPAVAVASQTLGKFNPAAAKELADDKQRAKTLREQKAADDLKRYTARATAIRAKIPPELFVRALAELTGSQPTSHLFVRGDHEQPKQKVGPAGLTVLGSKISIPSNDASLPTSGRRLAYAKHLTSGRHPLLARVLVNRIWAHHFGRGLVNSLGDFGKLGDRPSHPQLLDWLADEFVSSGWSVKHMHRLIMQSGVYRQSSRRTNELDQIDPDNVLLGRMTIRRLEAESIRDSVLAVSGKLNAKLYGEAVPVMEDAVGQIVIGKENLDGERKPTKAIPLNGEEYRRSLYIQVRRSRPLAVLETFDIPAMSPNCTQRNASNAAPQSLLLMNSNFAIEYAREFAKRVMREAGDDDQQRIVRAWRLALAKRPSAEQIAAAQRFLAKQQSQFDKQPNASPRFDALASFCQALLSSNAFIYVD